MPSTQRNPCTTGTSLTKRSRPHLPLASLPHRRLTRGGELDFPLKKEEDEAEPSGGAPEPEAKPEEKREAVQEAE